jgi:alkanesulfonate monooxygenase SsuD/methylene tetrahydromethanopterin reductase-like flavin-dependent oxidoreductase (luciferase family)
VVGGGSDAACRRAALLGDGYQASAMGPEGYAKRAAKVRAAAKEAGRPVPRLSARVGIRLGAREGSGYAMRGDPEDVATEIQAFAALGVTHLVLSFGVTDPASVVAAAEAFARDVAPLVPG